VFRREKVAPLEISGSHRTQLIVIPQLIVIQQLIVITQLIVILSKAKNPRILLEAARFSSRFLSH
jgi:hypothetical protein